MEVNKMKYGYVRVSTTTQNVDRQLDEMLNKVLMKNKFTLISKVEKILKDLIIKK